MISFNNHNNFHRIPDPIELQRKLMEAQGTLPPVSNIRMRIAAKAQQANQLLKSGMFTDDEVSRFAHVPKSVVEAEKARLEEEEKDRRRFLRTGQLTTIMSKGEGGYVAILQK